MWHPVWMVLDIRPLLQPVGPGNKRGNDTVYYQSPPSSRPALGTETGRTSKN